MTRVALLIMMKKLPLTHLLVNIDKGECLLWDDESDVGDDLESPAKPEKQEEGFQAKERRQCMLFLRL